jgi:protein-arginine kinase activator protein McsA
MEALLGTAQERADRLRGLQERMREAIDSEQYELAARIRDEIRRAGGAHHTQEGSSS